MASKSVACDGDVNATAGTTPSTKADSGTWTAGAVSLTLYDNLKVGGVKVASQAKCDFSFKGTKGNTAVTDSSTVTLSASSTVLQVGGGFVLFEGDSNQDSYGNTVAVSSTQALGTE